MQVSIVFKECKRCGAFYYGGKGVELSPNQQVELIFNKVVQCPHCPPELGPRTPGYRKI